MSLLTIGTRSVATVPANANVAQVVELMHDRSVGSLVVMEADEPVGIVTDRDLVLRVLRRGLNPKRTKVADAMSSPLVTVSDDTEAIEAASIMRERQIRRLPVRGADGALVGIVCFDDLVFHLARAHQELCRALPRFAAGLG